MTDGGTSEMDPAVQARRDAIDVEAREWLTHLYAGEITEQVEAGFRAWLAQSPDHRTAFQELNDLWTSLDRVPEIEQGLLEGSANASQVATPFPGGLRSGWRRVLRRAAKAGIAVGLVAGIAAMATLVTLHVARRADERQFATALGEVRTLGLTDGSQLVMRADTAIVTSMSEEERSVIIERGGAYFDVTKDENRPFVVSAAGVDVRVHGTAFDVLKGPSSVTVSVTHGRVAVSDVTNDSGAHTVELTGGQQVTVEADGTFGAVTEFDPQRVLGWRDGRLSYFNARLEDIIADINRYRTAKIGIEDEALKDLRITTMFRVEHTDQMLAGIEATEPVTIVRSSSSIMIRRRETK